MKIKEMFMTETIAILKNFQEEIIKKYQMKSFYIYEHKGDIVLSMIEVPKGSRKEGIGSAVMHELTRLADTLGKRIVLMTGLKDNLHGTTSGARLKQFYKRFDFVENKGRNKDFTISENMYRNPK